MTTATMTRPEKAAMNGVDVPTLLGTVAFVGDNPDVAKFQFRAKSEWIDGTHSRGTVNGYYGAGGEQSRNQNFVVEADHPAVLCGADNAPTPVEYLLTGLAACITAGIGNIASARQIELKSVRTSVEGDIDLRGLLGLDETVRNGFNAIRVKVAVEGSADATKLAAVVQQSVARSAVFDMLSNGTDVTVEVA